MNTSTTIDKIQPAYQLGNGDYLRQKLKGRSSAVRIVPETFESCFTSFDAYVDAHLKYHPPAIVRLAAYSEEQRESYSRCCVA